MRFECTDFACGAEPVGDGSAVVAVRGELDMHSSEELAELLDGLHERGISDHLVIDLSECTFMDSIGLSVIIRAQHLAKSPLNVVVNSAALRRVLSVTGLDSIFTLHETQADALDELERHVGTLLSDACQTSASPRADGRRSSSPIHGRSASSTDSWT